jgi:hypothetical protein
MLTHKKTFILPKNHTKNSSQKSISHVAICAATSRHPHHMHHTHTRSLSRMYQFFPLALLNTHSHTLDTFKKILSFNIWLIFNRQIERACLSPTHCSSRQHEKKHSNWIRLWMKGIYFPFSRSCSRFQYACTYPCDTPRHLIYPELSRARSLCCFK